MNNSTSMLSTQDALAQVARNLYAAAEATDAAARRAGPGSSGHLWGLGLQLAAVQATYLLDDASLVDDDAAGGPSPAKREIDVAGLVAAAYDQVSVLPVGPGHPGVSELIVTVGDLARQVRG